MNKKKIIDHIRGALVRETNKQSSVMLSVAPLFGWPYVVNNTPLLTQTYPKKPP